MKVILLENLKKIGSIGEVIDVKRGFARNFLIANKKALYASKENISQVEKIKSELSKKDNDRKKNVIKIKVGSVAYPRMVNTLHDLKVFITTKKDPIPLYAMARGPNCHRVVCHCTISPFSIKA